MTVFENPLKSLAEFNDIEKYINTKTSPILVSDLTDVSKLHFISELLKNERKWKLIITYDETRAIQIYEDMKAFERNVLLYPASDFLFFYADIQGHLITKERINVWQHLSEDESGVVVTTIDAIMDKIEEYNQFKSSVLTINETDSIDLEELSKKLIQLGYERMSEVDGIGQFCIRGGIIDIFSLTGENPVRIELWDNEIDSMRFFDVQSQRSIENISNIKIYPAKEVKTGGKYSFLRYFDIDTSLFFLDEPYRIYDRAILIEKEFSDGIAGSIEIGQVNGRELPEYISTEEIFGDLNIYNTISLSDIGHKTDKIRIGKHFSIQSRELVSYKNALDMLIEDLKKYKKENYKVIVLAASRARVDRLIRMFSDCELIINKCDEEKENKLISGQILVGYGNVHKSFEYTDLDFVLISENDILEGAGKEKRKHLRVKGKNEGKISSLNELKVGDYVIHEDNGLGIYKGIEQIERDDVLRDYIKIEYLGGDNCYVPTSKLDRIQKYLATRETPPKLSKLGGLEWSKTKARVKKAIENIAKDLVSLYSARLSGTGHVYRQDTDWQREFEEVFPYEETEDQIKAIADVKKDMETGKIMDRLICGDVGYGKTEVALRATFKVIQEGKQVIYLVPTTILAQQHFNTFTQRMKDFPVKVGLMCRFRTAKEQRETLEEFKKGFVDIIIGTHRVLSKDVLARDLGLVIVDEEQRFGVTHKEKLKKLKENVNVLTLTATPIPRTLHMSLVGIRDLSILEEPPIDRKPIQTYVMEYHKEIVREAILREVSRGGQVYYVYNRVEDIDKVASDIMSIVPNVKVAFAHGKMSERELEKIMLEFINGDIDVLVSTTIIETGLDIPNANTMIVHDCDRFGLSQLYQLRGRIGRSSRTSYAFLMYKRDKLISEEAQKRLKAIREFTELGSGIKIAMRDLEIRGAGNVLGAEQHGHMQAIGYELYCKLLNISIKKIKGEEVIGEEFETEIDILLDAYIPSSYISNEENKLDLYKRIASIEKHEDYSDIQDELIDRFGELNNSVENLLDIALLKSLAHGAYIKYINVKDNEIRLRFYENAKISMENIHKIVERFKPYLKIDTTHMAELLYKEKNIEIRVLLKKALDIVSYIKSVERLDKVT